MKAKPAQTDAELIASVRKRFWSDAIDVEQKKFERGDRVALFAAIRLCANHDQALPEWVARGFIEGYDQILNCRKGSWDEAFGRPFPKNSKLHALRKRRVNAIKAANLVRAAQDRGESVADELFEKIGKKLAMSGSAVSKLYYSSAKPFRIEPKKSR